MNRFTYYDQRSGDTYHVETSSQGFAFALRYMDGNMHNPTLYTRLSDLHADVAAKIEQKVEELKYKK